MTAKYPMPFHSLQMFKTIIIHRPYQTAQ